MRQSAPQPAAAVAEPPPASPPLPLPLLPPPPPPVRSLMIFLMTSPLLGYGFPWGFLGVGGSPPSMAPTGTLAGEKNRRRLGVVYWFCVE